jgi:hypothetical protein
LPSIMTAPLPPGIAARVFSANFTSPTSGENTRLTMATWLGFSVQPPAQQVPEFDHDGASLSARRRP